MPLKYIKTLRQNITSNSLKTLSLTKLCTEKQMFRNKLLTLSLPRSLSENRLPYCESAEFCHFLRSFSLNRTTIRLKGPQKLPQTCSSSLRALFSDKVLGCFRTNQIFKSDRSCSWSIGLAI